MKLKHLIDGVQKRDIVLPEFQREYVWNREQAKQLLFSLVRGYPVGGVLLWKTDTPPELKNLETLPQKLGTVNVLLDGQQRLTTLHMFTTGEIPNWYTAADIERDPRDLYYHLHTADFQYYQASKMKDDPLWVRVVDCFTRKDDINAFKIASEMGVAGQEAFDLAQRLSDNLTRLRSVTEVDLPEQVVPPHASLDEAIDIFDRVNSLGTKLTDAELALTHVTGKWPAARKLMKAKIAACGDKGFDFSLAFTTRALTVVVTNRALYEMIHPRPRPELEAGWSQLTRILDYLITFLPRRAFVHSTADMNTSNALIPLVAYLALHGGKLPNDRAVRHATNWFYAALMWARYTSQTDQRLESDVAIVVKESEPWDLLRSQIVDQRGRIEVKASDFEGRGVQSPFYQATYILAKTHGATDWFNGLPVWQTTGASYSIHSHHVFPTSQLYGHGWDADNYMHRQAVNEIANRAFLTADSNVPLANTLPEEYLPGVEERYPGVLAQQFIPMEPSLWRIDRYPEFLAARRELIARKMNEYMDSLISEPEPTHHRPIAELVQIGESHVLEFKSTLQWDVVQEKPNPPLRRQVLKTIAAFMNSQGGTLVIGVEDDGTPLGLARDLQLTKGTTDGFQQLLSTLVFEFIGAAFAPYFRVRFDALDGQTVCVVDVDRAPEPAFVKGEGGKDFFVRMANTTRVLNTEDAVQYIAMHWE